MADEDAKTRLLVIRLEGAGNEGVDIDETASVASDRINEAVRNGDTFVYFQRPDQTGVAVKVNRILHVAERVADSA